MKIKQAVILAGGLGTRLHPLTLSYPKPLIPIHSKPFLEYIIQNLIENEIKEIIILVGFMGEKIEKYFGDGEKYGIKIKYSYSPVEYDTGSRIREAFKMLNNNFLLLYCDNSWPLNLNKLTKFYEKAGTQALVTIYENLDNYTKNNMYINEQNLVKAYDKTHKTKNLNGVDIGFFIFNKNVFNNLPKTNFSFEKEVIPALIQKKQLSGYLTKHKYYGLSNLDRIKQIEKYLKPKKVILLDRDGVINKKPLKGEYVNNWREFKFLKDSIKALKFLTKEGYEIFIISNQAGIARGAMSITDLQEINKYFLNECKKNKIKINGIYYCPHGWDDNCSCRKPKPGMLFQAAYDHSFDLTKAIFIGDDPRDMEAGMAADCKTILVMPTKSLYNVARNLNDNFKNSTKN